MRWVILTSLVAATGCAGNSGCDAEELEEGTVLATLDGTAWEGGGASFLWAGDGVQVNSVRTNGWMLTLKLESTSSGGTLREAMDGGQAPVDVLLEEDGLSGWLTAYPESGGSYTSKNEVGGTVTVTEMSETHLSACFDLRVEAGDGDSFEVTGGQLRAAVME